MNLNYAIFRSQPIMTINDLAQIGSHNKREKQAYKSNPDIKLELRDNNIDYIVLNSLMHKEEDFNLVVDEYIEALNGKEFNKKDVFTGFLYKESIFKVK